MNGILEPVSMLQLALAIYVAGAIAGLVFIKFERAANALSFGCALFGGLFGLIAGATALITGAATNTSFSVLPSLIPYVEFAGQLDALSAFFVMVVSLLALALSIYSLGYAPAFCGGKLLSPTLSSDFVRGEAVSRLGRKSVGLLGAGFNLLLLATTVVFVADNAFFFLIAWEIMALTAFALVTFEHEKEETRRAGVLYFVMSHIGTGCLLLGFLLLFQASGDHAFSGFHEIGDHMPAGRRNAAFVLFLIGFGVKAGIVPLHIWLPAAHPVAPSNVSALMSGVIIKTGIYGITRVCFDFLGTPPNWWGVALLSIGTISAVLGVLYALMEHDLKRLLAYHSIENIGIILMGLGAAMMFLHSEKPMLASMALIAALYHTFNHAVFKALLFLGAGAVLHSTHTRNMEEMGGLAKRMRWTAFFFLIGAIAISALPPLNGFVSEWLTYQSLLQGFETTTSLIRILFPLSGAMLALTGALAAACFVKAFGITFLAQPRSTHARDAHEAPFSMLAAQALLTAACVFLGLAPGLFLRVLDPVTAQATGFELSHPLTSANDWTLSALAENGGRVSTLGIAFMGIALLSIPLALQWTFARSARTRRGPTWDCGLRGLTPQMEYTATGFSKPIRMIFKALFRPRREVQREYDFSPYFATTIRFESHVEEVFQTRIYRPLNRLVLRTSRRLRALQAGSIHAYLIYIFITLLVLLLMFGI